MYELVLKGEVVDRAPLANLEQAKLFFVKRKQMTEFQTLINTSKFDDKCGKE